MPTATETMHANDLIAIIAPAIGDRPVIVEHTGGNCATIIITCAADGRDGELLIGPGAYHWDDPSTSEFSFEELYIGGDWTEDGDYVATPDQLAPTVARWIDAHANGWDAPQVRLAAPTDLSS